MREGVVCSIVGVLHSLLWLEVRRAESLAHVLALVHLGSMRELLLVHLRVVVYLVCDFNDLDFVTAVILVLLLVILGHLELIRKHRLPLLLHLQELPLSVLLSRWHDLRDVWLLCVLEAHIRRHVRIHISKVCCLEIEHVLLTVVGQIIIILWRILEIIICSGLVDLREVGCHHVKVVWSRWLLEHLPRVHHVLEILEILHILHVLEVKLHLLHILEVWHLIEVVHIGHHTLNVCHGLHTSLETGKVLVEILPEVLWSNLLLLLIISLLLLLLLLQGLPLTLVSIRSSLVTVNVLLYLNANYVNRHGLRWLLLISRGALCRWLLLARWRIGGHQAGLWMELLTSGHQAVH